MNIKNLWPPMEEIINPSEENPSNILNEQAAYFNNMFADKIKIKVIKAPSSVDDIPLCVGMPPVHELFELDNYSIPTNVLTQRFVVYSIPNNIVVGELLRIRYKQNKNYPVELYDCLNDKSYTLVDYKNFENCLEDIFKSKRVKQSIRNILS